MADEALDQPGISGSGWSEPAPIEAPLQRAPKAKGPGQWLLVLVAFLLGGGIVGWLGWESGADFEHFPALTQGTGTAQPGATATALAGSDMQGATRDEMALAGRVAAMEQRMDRVDLRVEAASGNAARAEALLVAFAARRVVERGAPLGYLADQLKLRFGDAQPNAVATIIAGNRDMVPMDQLAARLEALAPQLTDSGRQTLWGRVMREVSGLFVVHRDRPAQSDADARFDDARKALSEGRIDDAVADVQHLSNGADVSRWSAAARRYRDVEAALDLIDTTALLAPHQLRDASGNAVDTVIR